MEHIPNQSIDADIYLRKFSVEKPLISTPCSPNTGLIIVIPSYGESHLTNTINSLFSTIPPLSKAEVIVVINDAEDSPNEMKSINQKSITDLDEIKKWTPKHIYLEYLYLNNLSTKKSGVGIARKTGMDEAVRRFSSINKNGIIVCLDADCTVDSNYLIALEKHFFFDYPKTPGADIYYEHSTDHPSQFINEGIIKYEIHLRYFVHCQKFAHCPYAFQTVGSSMAVRSEAYQKQGGMNSRKAGEDFYFLHKIISLGNFTSVNNTRVIPSPRISKRVPFGTGRAQQEFAVKKELMSYNFTIFKMIKEFTSQFLHLHNSSFLHVHYKLEEWLISENFSTKLQEIKENTQSIESFEKRLWQWFNAFKFMKLTHFLRDELYPNRPIMEEANKLTFEVFGQTHLETNELLQYLRKVDYSQKK